MLVSIVIPVKNAAPWLDSLLASILSQEGDFETELIILDSESTDETTEILKKYSVEYYSIPPGEFNHGVTRNFGASKAKGEVVVMTVQDAIPANSLWLKELLDGFLDCNVIGVCGKQIVPKSANKNPLEWFSPINELQIKRGGHCDLNTISATDCGWDNVTAAYKRSFLIEKIPFRKVKFGEDAYWAKDALLSGYDLVYNDRALVYHYHHEDSDFTYKRSIEEFYLKYSLFNIEPEVKYIDFWGRIKVALSILMKMKSFKKWQYWCNYNYIKNKTIFSASEDFKRHLSKGHKSIEDFYSEVCNVSVIANKI